MHANIRVWPLILTKTCFSCARKITDDWGFYFFPIIPDFADIMTYRQNSVPDFLDYDLDWTCNCAKRWKFIHKCKQNYSNMEAHKFILHRSQYILILALTNGRFSILKKKTEANQTKIEEVPHSFTSCTYQAESISFDVCGWVQNSFKITGSNFMISINTISIFASWATDFK